MFGRKSRGQAKYAAVQTVPDDCRCDEIGSLVSLSYKSERQLYSALREAVPVIDAAICKTVRLLGTFKIKTDSAEGDRLAESFVQNVKVNGSSAGLYNFICSYFDSMITYGEAVGEMIPNAAFDGISALYNANLDDVEVALGGSPLELEVFVKDGVSLTPVRNRELVLVSLLNQRHGLAKGTSVMSGLPFLSSVLLRIFGSLKANWERLGDLRFAVTYSPEDGSAMSAENAKIIADEWKKAMRSDRVCDFVSVGDVKIKVIGAESQMPDCEVPVRTIMEQLIAKLGIPPFLLGLSWSSTERMSEQQADILTSELEHYREALNPVIKQIVTTHLRLCGINSEVKVDWDFINLQDTLELSQARLNNAQAMVLEKDNGLEALDE